MRRRAVCVRSCVSPHSERRVRSATPRPAGDRVESAPALRPDTPRCPMDDSVPHVDAIPVTGPAPAPQTRPSTPAAPAPGPIIPVAIEPKVRAGSVFSPDRRVVIVAGVFAVASAVAVVPAAFLVRVLVDQAASGDPTQPWYVPIVGVIVFAGLAAAFRVGGTLLADHVGRSVVIRTADALTRAGGGGATWSHVIAVRSAARNVFVNRPFAVAAVVVGSGGLALLHPVLAQVALGLGVAALIAFIGIRDRASADAEARLGQWIATIAQSPASLRVGPGRAVARDRAATLTSMWINASSVGRTLLRRAVAFAVVPGCGIAVVWAAGGLLAGGLLSPGEFVAALMSGGLAVVGIAMIVASAGDRSTLAVVAERLAGVRPAPPERESRMTLPATDLGMEVRVRGVSLPPGLVGPVTWNVRPRQRVGVVGKSGGGKSTLLDTIAGIRPPAAGVVELDGLDVRTLDPEAVGAQVVTVRGTELFPGTVRENLLLGRTPDADILHRALATTGLTAVVEQLPGGLDATLGPGGTPLTPNQALRLTLARAMVARPRLLLLDAVLDGLPFGEFPDLVLALFDRAAPWTLIVASSDPRVLSRCEATHNLTGRERPTTWRLGGAGNPTASGGRQPPE